MFDDTLPEVLSATEQQQVPLELLQSQQQLDQPEPEQQPQEQQEQRKQQRQESKDKASNFAAMRQKIEALERERDEARSQLAEKENDYDVNLGPDDFAEGKHLIKVQKQLSDLKKELQSYKVQSSQQTTEARIKAQYSDFDAVVTAETVATLIESYPELATTLKSAPDLYTQAASAYTLIKKLGIVPESSYSADKQRTQTNYAKPRSTASIAPQQGSSPLTRANEFAEGLTDDLKNQLLKEMTSSRRGY